LVNNLVLQENA